MLGKLYGTKHNGKQPILAVHGWMDNAGTFDYLAPLLDSPILAIDLPGHGLSSWLPRGLPYSEDIFIISMRWVVSNFKWNKVKLLGHSMGGILTYNYARLYPAETQFAISIDALATIPNNATRYTQDRSKAIDELIAFERKVKGSPPSYPEEVAINKWMTSTRFSSLDVPTTKTLMIRGAKKRDDGTYHFTRDFRLSIKGFNSYNQPEDLKLMTRRIVCPYLVLKASQTFFKDEYWVDASEVLLESSQDFRIVTLKGGHHMHMMNPEMVAKEINPFLAKYNL